MGDDDKKPQKPETAEKPGRREKPDLGTEINKGGKEGKTKNEP